MNTTKQIARRGFLARAGLLLSASLPGTPVRADELLPVPSIADRLRQAADAAPLALRFQGTTAAACRDWQTSFAAKLRGLLGPHTPPSKWKAIPGPIVHRADHRREEYRLVADGHPPLPLYVLVPSARGKGRRPAVLALHGHGSHGHHPVAGRDDRPGVADAIRSANYDYGRQLVRRGYVVAVPCLTPFGDRLGKREVFGKQDPCSDVFLRLLMLGKVLMAENLRDCLWAIELLARRDDVDPKRLGCVGLSYGGRMTTLTAALEPRIRVAVISGALNVMQERISKPYSCGAQVIPGLLAYGDVPEIASLIAPRPCLWEVGSRDALIDAKRADEALGHVRRAYRALGAVEQVHVDRFEGGHVWNGKKANVLLDEVLR